MVKTQVRNNTPYFTSISSTRQPKSCGYIRINLVAQGSVSPGQEYVTAQLNQCLFTETEKM